MTMVERGMKTTTHAAASLSDVALIEEVKVAAGRECAATAQLIALLAEFDARRLYLGEGCSSLFTYCTQVLHLSEHAAYGRIEAARVVRRLPRVLESLSDGVTLTNVTLLAPHLTTENHKALRKEARDKTKREVELMVALLRPRPRLQRSYEVADARGCRDTKAHNPDCVSPVLAVETVRHAHVPRLNWALVQSDKAEAPRTPQAMVGELHRYWLLLERPSRSCSSANHSAAFGLGCI